MSPESFRQVADCFPDAVLLLAKDGTVLAANRHAAALGAFPSPIVGRSLCDLAATSAPAVQDYLRLCSRSREPVVGSLVLRTGAGQEVPCRCYGSALHADGQGGPPGILLRLVPRDSAPSQFAVLNQKLDELTKEVQRRKQAEARWQQALECHRTMEEHLTALVQASATLTGTLEPPTVLASILGLSERLLPADAYAVWRLDARSGRWQIALASGLSEAYRQAMIRVLEQTPGMPETPVIAEDVFASPLLAERKAAYTAEGIRSLLAAPLRIRGQICGTLVFYHRQPHRFGEIEVRLATALANLSAAALGSADVYEEQIRLRTEAQEHQERLRVTLASIGDAVIATDTAGRVTFLNPVAESLTGWPLTEGQGRPLEEVFRIVQEGSGQPAESPVARVLREGTIVGLANHTILIARDGTRFPIDDSAAPIQDQQHHVVGVVLVFRDNSERRRAEAALRRSEQDTRFLADASAALAGLVDYETTLRKVAQLAVPTFADWCAVDMLDEGGTLRRLAVAHVDPAKVQLAHELHRRYPPDPNAPQGVWNILRTGKSEMVSDITDDLVNATVPDANLRGILSELGLRSYMGVPLALRNHVLGVVTFIAAESGRRYDAADLALAEDLAHRAAVAIENARLYQALREADRRKDEFLATLAHELRNPLAPIRNALQLLRLAGPNPVLLEQARSMMERQLGQMVRLIDDLLDVSRISRGKLELRKERVDLAAVVHSALETARPLIEAAGHELSVTLPAEPVLLDADPTRLAQVIANLLNNAAKYTNRGGRLSVQAERLAGEALVRVRDTGIGIPADQLPHIFEMFVQVDRSLERSQGGLGIGLTLVQRLVAMHGGTVEAHSDGPGKGSEFVVRLPVLQVPAVELGPPGPEAPAAPAPRTRILVVDDNRDAAESLGLMLRIMGYEVRTAHDGVEAVALVEAFRPDVVLLDLGMPRLNGYDAARRIRAQEGGKRTRLVALTGWGQEEDRRRTHEVGFDEHLVKPVDPAVLQDMLARLGPGREAS